MRLWFGAAFIVLVGIVLAVHALQGSFVVDMVVALALAGLFSLALERLLVGPMHRLDEAASAIAQGNFDSRVRPRPQGEIGDVADAFNSMAQRVQEQVDAASQERSRLAAALNSSIDAVAAVDREGRILFANSALERLFEQRSEDLVGRPFAWLLPEEHVMEAVRLSHDRQSHEIASVELPGRQYLQVITTPIEGGGEWAVLVVFHDLSDMRRTEFMRRDFVANVSHELRTPLAAIKSVVETLADGALDDRATAVDFLRRADEEVDRLVELVEELLELSRIESGQLRLVLRDTEVAGLLRDAVERIRPQAERSGQTLVLDLDGDLGHIMLDSARIERAVLNLLQNAIKFTPEGGSVTLSARLADGSLVIMVSDTGIGIDAAEQLRIFERFYKVDQSRASIGSGLGLALVKHAIEMHGGSVSVESRLGHGAVFVLRIPATPVQQPA